MRKLNLLAILLFVFIFACDKDTDNVISTNDILVKNSPWVLNPKYHISISNCQDSSVWNQYYDNQYYETYSSSGLFHVEGRNISGCEFNDKYSQDGRWLLSDNKQIIDYNIDGTSSTGTIIKITNDELIYKYVINNSESTYYLIPLK